MVIRKTGPGPNPARMARVAAEELKKKSAGVDANNPALAALAISTVEHVIADDEFVKKGGLSSADLASLKVEVASATATALEGLSIHGAAEKAATGLRHGEIIRGQQAKVIAQISEVDPSGPVSVDPKALAADLAAIFDNGAKTGSLLAHDLWYADALPRTVQGEKSNDLGVDVGGGNARARPFMAPSTVILESGDQNLIKTMEGLNIAGVQAALLGVADAAGGTFAAGKEGADHLASAKSLANPLEGQAPSAQLSDPTKRYLQKLGSEIVKAEHAFARNQEPDWKELPLAHSALKGSHQRWLQLLSYDPDPSQMVDYDKLGFGDKKNTVSSVIAGVFGAMKAGGMIPDELVAGVPAILERSPSSNESVSLRLETLSDKPALVLRDGRTQTGGADWVLRVDGKENKPVALGAARDGSKAAASFLEPGSKIEVVDKRSGMARTFTVPDSIFQKLDGESMRLEARGRLGQLEAQLTKSTAKRSDVAEEARELIALLAKGNSVGDAKELASAMPKLMAEVPLAVLGGDEKNVAYVLGGELKTMEVTPENASDMLKHVKVVDDKLQTDSVEIRRAVLKRSGGAIPTSDVYTYKSDVPRKEKWDYLDPLENWAVGRRDMHETLFARAMAEATGLNEVISRPGQKPTVVAMRGNTAVGKTRTLITVDSLKEGAAYMKSNPTAAINPDPLKAEIAAVEQNAGVTVSSNQAHEEGSAISWRLMQSMQKAAMSMIVDRRLGSPNDVSDIIASAEANGKNVELIDVEAPLAFSLMGVLMRKPGGVDPIVPFSAIAYGFSEVREGRLRVLERVMDSDSVTRYDLYTTTPDGGKSIVAKKRDTELEIVDQKLFDAAVAMPEREVETLRTRKIDDALIQELTGQLPAGFKEAASGALGAYQGKTFEEALEAHGKKAAA